MKIIIEKNKSNWNQVREKRPENRLKNYGKKFTKIIIFISQSRIKRLLIVIDSTVQRRKNDHLDEFK